VGALAPDAKLVDLPPQQAANPVTRRRFREQWSESNPRFHAAHAVASYLERDAVAPLNAGGTLYSDEREILEPERDYWQPRVAVHFGAKLLKWALLVFGQGIPRVLVVLNPTVRKQTLRALDVGRRTDQGERPACPRDLSPRLVGAGSAISNLPFPAIFSASGHGYHYRVPPLHGGALTSRSTGQFAGPLRAAGISESCLALDGGALWCWFRQQN
jgi:hypothetical protein